jgi:hypothetical protein
MEWWFGKDVIKIKSVWNMGVGSGIATSGTMLECKVLKR